MTGPMILPGFGEGDHALAWWRGGAAPAPLHHAKTHGPPPREDGEDLPAVAHRFEALFIAQILKSAHGAALAEDPLAGDDTSFRDLQDAARAQAIAAAAPLGVLRALAGRAVIPAQAVTPPPPAVIPAQAGIHAGPQASGGRDARPWIPAFAGMTP